MNIAIASEKVSYGLKESIKQHLLAQGHNVIDVGQTDPDAEALPYSCVGANMAEALNSGRAELGIVSCGTGAGVSLACNKCRNIYAVACESVYSASLAPQIVNANVLAMGSRIVGTDMACAMADAFIRSKYLEGFPEARANFIDSLHKKLISLENENMK